MWSLAAGIFAACKGLTWVATPAAAPAWRHAAYLFAWPGLDAKGFLESGGPRPRPREWIDAAARTLTGLGLLFIAVPAARAQDPYLVGWIGMIGLILVLHFGLFHLLSCAWRRAGVQARPLMNRPLVSTSLGEFWGRRWNTAFRDLTYRFLFRPLTSRFGTRWGLLAGFFFSGLVHDLVISVPARGGYGGPTLFFAVQAMAMLVERTGAGRRFGLGAGVRGWLFTMIVLVAPVTLLFHRPFVVDIIVPFLRAIGALT